MSPSVITYSPGQCSDAPIIRLPESKSIWARLMMLEAVEGSRTAIPDEGECRDLKSLKSALDMVKESVGSCKPLLVDIDESGTALRFVTAYAAALPGSNIVITGGGAIPCRPMAPLVSTLVEMGAEVEYKGVKGYAPLHIRGKKLRPAPLSNLFGLSSQFVSAIILISPLAGIELSEIILPADMPSLPYAQMTLKMAADSAYRQKEADWSGASFFYEFCALSGRSICLRGLNKDSLQPDSRGADIFKLLGVETIYSSQYDSLQLVATGEAEPSIDINMGQNPDLVPPFLCAGAFLCKDIAVRGIDALRIKECDRVEALMSMLHALGIKSGYTPDAGGTIYAHGRMTSIREEYFIETYSDHRIAMAAASVIPALHVGTRLTQSNSACVDKSFPQFFTEMKKLDVICKEL